MKLSRRSRITGLIAATAAALLLALAAMVGQQLRPTALKARIEREVLETTGLALHIEGELRWQAWPEPVVWIGQGRVEVPGSGGGPAVAVAPLARWRVFAAEARWSPLIHGELRLASLKLEGLSVTVARGADGAIAWPKLGGAGAKSERSRVLTLDRLEIVDGEVRVEGASTVSAAAAGKGAPVGSTALEALQLRTGLAYDPADGTLALDDFSLQGIAHAGPLPPDGVPVALATPRLRLEQAPLRLTAPSLQARFAGLEAEARFDGPVDLATPAATGKLHLATPSMRELMRTLGVDLPPTRDPRAFGALELESAWRVDATVAQLEPLRLKLSDDEFTGAARTPLAGPAPGQPARFVLKGGKLDLTRFLRPKDQPGEPFKLPVEAMRRLHVEGEVQLEEARLAGGVMRGVRLRVIDKAGP